ncbi:hypothetical protein EJ06DRAFT_583229 [Trichodelitschia bisporula]|uniref:Uncharacterized protein n=1 Tax=Trichodelitschia bisporula TaxID=703511 RepID=A0A6G1HUA0_9PEZI|nr:hypothetical protein EJ06DRAFT_583229 [Trichodelitschia bisporula]
MPKNNGKGGKNRRRRKSNPDYEDPAPSTITTHLAPILRLPNELLDQIFTLAGGEHMCGCLIRNRSPDARAAHNAEHKLPATARMLELVGLPWVKALHIISVGTCSDFRNNYASIAAVCRRFVQVATPLLYRNLAVFDFRFYYPGDIFEKSLNLYNTLGMNRHLLKHTRRLKINIPSVALDDYDRRMTMIVDFLSWHPNVRSLCLNEPDGALEPGEIYRLIQHATQHMRRLEELHLTLTGAPPLPYTTFEEHGYEKQDDYRAWNWKEEVGVVEIPQVRRLRVDCVPEMQDKEPAGFLPNKIACKALTTLELRAFFGQPQDLPPVLSWPEALEDLTLSITPIVEEEYLWYDTLQFELQKGLEHQRKSLRNLKIIKGRQPEEGYDEGQYFFNINVSEFPRLETLTIPSHHTPPEFEKLVGPVQHTLVIDYSLKGDKRTWRHKRFADLAERPQLKAPWLDMLVDTLGDGHSASLRTIRMKACTACWRWWIKATYVPGWPYTLPWETFHYLKGKAATYGIDVVFDPPPFTRNEISAKDIGETDIAEGCEGSHLEGHEWV